MATQNVNKPREAMSAAMTKAKSGGARLKDAAGRGITTARLRSTQGPRRQIEEEGERPELYSTNKSPQKDREKLRSGFLDKPRSQVVVKLAWPHMNQNPRYVADCLSFNQLNFCQFVGGECRTILKTLDETEQVGRLRVLSKISYLYDQCRDWDKACSAYFAIVSSIEEGEALWSSSFGHYDIMCPPKQDDAPPRWEGKAMSKTQGGTEEGFLL